MPDFIIILLKINLVLILFAAAYYLILRRLTFYVINRVFLVFGILFSTLYPFIDLTDFFHNQNQQIVAFVPELNQKVATMVPLDFISNYWLWISMLFYVGVLIMAVRLVIQFVSLYRMHKKSSPGSIADFEVRILDEPVSPFSFWQTVYINPTLHKEKELQTILTHEQIHVKEWHSLDIILAELSVVFYWFNPGVWLMKRAVKENLEYITDEKILKKGIDKKDYQYSLLDASNLIPAVEIVNNFNLADLKKRIKMMNVKRSSKLTLSRYMLVLPVLLLTTLAFTVSKKDIKKHLSPITNVISNAVSNGVDSPILDISITTNSKAGIKRGHEKNSNLNQKTNVINVVLNFKDTINDGMDKVTKQLLIQMASQSAKQGDTSIFLTKSVHGMDLNAKQTEFLFAKTQEISKSSKDKITDKMVYVVRGVEYKAKKADQDVEGVLVTNIKRPVDFDDKPSNTKIVLKGYKTGTNPADSIDVSKVNFYFNGQKMTQEGLNKINPNHIKSVDVKKGEALSEVVIVGYGQKVKP